MNMRQAVSLTICLGTLVCAVVSSFPNKVTGGTSRVAWADEKDIPPSTPEPTDRLPETYQGSFFYTSAGQMLAALGVAVAPEDKVYAFPDPSLGIGSHLRVFRAQLVTIKDGTSERTVHTWSKTVFDLFKEQHIDLADKDSVQPSQQSMITLANQPFVITITRVAEAQLTVSQAIDYDTQYVDAPDLERGQQRVQQAGSAGTLSKTYLVHRENGSETWRKLLDETVLTKPVSQIIQRGTKVVDFGTGGASWYDGVPALTAAHRTLPMGTRVKVTNLANGRSVVVTIADRGPFVGGRIIDLSADSFAQIASPGSGVISVRLEKM